MTLPAGHLLGRFEILGLLGAGGMGEVYRARDTRLDRIVAVKRPKGAADRRFDREARAIAALNHPHICQIYDVGPDYLVMEYVEGKPLSGPMPLDESLLTARRIADALDTAHRHGVLHRDLKPANILMTESGPKILDFGLAKLISEPDPEATALTAEGAVVGTAAYMSPEQAQGRPLDERSDIFSFGAVLYEMLSGQRAFTGASQAEVMTAVLRDEPQRIDSPAWPIVERCLAKQPADRFQNIAELRAALASGSNESAAWKTSRPRPSIAVLPFSNLGADREQDYFGEGLAEEIINLLARIAGLKVIARTSAFAFRDREQDVRRIAAALNVTNILEGSVRRNGSQIRVNAQLISADDGAHLFSNRYDREMADVFAMQDEIAGAIAEALRVELADLLSERRRYTPSLPAYEAVLKARHFLNRVTPDAMAKGREYLEQAIALDPGYALPHGELAFHFSALAVLGMMPAHAAAPLVKASAQRALAIDPHQPEALAALGSVAALYDYDWAQAGRLFSRAAEDDQIAPRVRRYHGLFLLALGHVSEAIEEYRRAVSEDPVNPLSRLVLTGGLLIADRPDEVARECRQMLEFHNGLSQAWGFLSMASFLLGDSETTIYAARRAASLAPWSLEFRGSLAGFLEAAGDAKGAQAVLASFVDPEAYGGPIGLVWYNLIRGNYEEASAAALRAIEQRASSILYLLRQPVAAGFRATEHWPELARAMRLPGSEETTVELARAADPA